VQARGGQPDAAGRKPGFPSLLCPPRPPGNAPKPRRAEEVGWLGVEGCRSGACGGTLAAWLPQRTGTFSRKLEGTRSSQHETGPTGGRRVFKPRTHPQARGSRRDGEHEQVPRTGLEE